MSDHRGPGAPKPNEAFITPAEVEALAVFKLRYPAEYPRILQAVANLEAWGLKRPVIVEGSSTPAETDVLYRIEGDLPGERYASEPHTHPLAALTEAGTWLYERLRSGAIADPSRSALPLLGPDGQPLS